VLEVVNGITQGLATLANSITLAKFLRWILTIIVIAAIVLYSYDSYGLISYYNKLDQKLRIIERVQVLAKGDSTISVHSRKKLLEILNDIDPPIKSGSVFLEDIDMSSKDLKVYFLKLLSAAVLPMLIVVANAKTLQKSDLLVGAGIYFIVFGILALIIPIVYSVWVNFLIILIAEIISLIILSKKNKYMQS
jgi:hypothetical protein